MQPAPARPGSGTASLEAALDAVREDLEAVDDLNPAEQLAVFGRIHTTLSQVLATAAVGESAPGASRGDAAVPGRPAGPIPGRPGGR